MTHAEYLANKKNSIIELDHKPDYKGDLNKLSAKEAIKIIDLQSEYENTIPKLIDPNTNKPYLMVNIAAIVLHQDMEVGEDALTSYIPKIIAGTTNNHHFVIDKEGVIFQLNPIMRAVSHCKYTKYSKRANEYFGDDICPLYEDTKTSPHDKFVSPNLKTLSICLPKIDEEGNIGNAAYTSLIRLCAYLINRHAPALQAQANIICNYYIPEDNSNHKDPLCFYSENDYYNLTREQIAEILKDDSKESEKDKRYLRFRYDVERLRGDWLIKYRNKSIVRGFPDIIYQNLVKN